MTKKQLNSIAVFLKKMNVKEYIFFMTPEQYEKEFMLCFDNIQDYGIFMLPPKVHSYTIGSFCIEGIDFHVLDIDKIDDFKLELQIDSKV